MGIKESAAAWQAKKRAEDKALADAKSMAAAQAAETENATKRYQASMLNMQVESQNLNTANRDLSTDVATNIVPGGTADSVAAAIKKRKKNVGTGIAAALGINV